MKKQQLVGRSTWQNKKKEKKTCVDVDKWHVYIDPPPQKKPPNYSNHLGIAVHVAPSQSF